MAEYTIFDLALRAGRIGIAPLPGRAGRYQADLNAIFRWGAGMVLTMTTADELAGDLETDLKAAGVFWRHLPIADFGAPSPEVAERWPEISGEALEILSNGGKVLAHCYGGCGRSGMALLSLMVDAGEEPEAALGRLRTVRPCAVETNAQFQWASGR